MMINVEITPGVIEQMDESLLTKREGAVDNDWEHTTWVEYWLNGVDKPVHRSAHVTMKQGVEGIGAIGEFN